MSLIGASKVKNSKSFLATCSGQNNGISERLGLSLFTFYRGLLVEFIFQLKTFLKVYKIS